MNNAALSGCLGFGFLVAVAGCEPVDDGAATRVEGWNHKLTDHVLPGDRGVFTDIPETMTVPDGCTKTEADALKVLADNCAKCHDGDNKEGLPPWNFVLDPERMKVETWPREGGDPIPFLKPGHPESSAIYMRAVISRNMPPVYTDVAIPTEPRVTYSGASVLYQWIANCM